MRRIAEPARAWASRWEIGSKAPGIALVAILAAAAFGLHAVPLVALISPIMIAMVLGLMFRLLFGVPNAAIPGVAFAAKKLLRVAIVLLGLQITWREITEVGGIGLAIVLIAFVSTFVFTVWFGRLLNVDRKLTQLIAAGTAVCGASAIVAVNTVSRADEQDVGYAIASITLFGTIAMLLLPLFGAAVSLDEASYGLWVGASVHEIAQVVGAAFQGGEIAGQTGVVSKLVRVVMLAPLVLVLSLLAGRGSSAGGKVPLIPWFIVAFLAVVLFNSLVGVPDMARQLAMQTTALLLAFTLAAMGLLIDVHKLRARGGRPLALAFAASIFIIGVTLGLVVLAQSAS